MATPRTHTTLSLKQKIKLIEAVGRKEKPMQDVAKDFGIKPSTLSTILRDKGKLLARFYANDIQRKRERQPKYPDLEDALMLRLNDCRNSNVNITGPLICQIADTLAKQMKYEGFKVSGGWLDRFKKRHGLAFRKICGEITPLGKNSMYENWKQQLVTLTEYYKPEDIFSANETGLFFKCLPGNICTENCRSGERSKERITVLLATNATGTEKLPPLVVGKSANPRCFRRVKSKPIEYRANRKAWMTSQLFSEWLVNFNREMKSQQRQILLFIGNSTAHTSIPKLSHIRVEFLPPNTTSKFQPLDQGITKKFKYFYRSEVVKKIIYDTEAQKKIWPISLLHAMRMIDKSWRKIPASTIINCFKQAGFQINSESDNVVANTPRDPQLWKQLNNALGVGIAVPRTFEEFVNMDETVAASGTMIEDSMDEVPDDDSEDEQDTVGETISNQQIISAVNTVRGYFEQSSNTSQEVYSLITQLELKIDAEIQNSSKQKKITDFFHYKNA